MRPKKQCVASASSCLPPQALGSSRKFVYLTNRYGPLTRSIGCSPDFFLSKHCFPVGDVLCRRWYDAWGFVSKGAAHKQRGLESVLNAALDDQQQQFVVSPPDATIAGTSGLPMRCLLLGDSTDKDFHIYTDFAVKHRDVDVFIAIRLVCRENTAGFAESREHVAFRLGSVVQRCQLHASPKCRVFLYATTEELRFELMRWGWLQTSPFSPP